MLCLIPSVTHQPLAHACIFKAWLTAKDAFADTQRGLAACLEVLLTT